MDEIQFEPRQASLSDRCYAKLARIARFLQENPTVDVRLAGTADRTAREDAQIAARRVQAVREAMVAVGIDVTRIQIATDAERVTPCTASAEDCQVFSRRVEVSMARRY